MTAPLTFLDLFCGCGGFSLGLQRAGLKGLAAIDFNHEAIEVFRANFEGIPHVLERDLTRFSPAEFSKVQSEARALGYRVHAQIEDCVKLGVPQKRRRQLFAGKASLLPVAQSVGSPTRT